MWLGWIELVWEGVFKCPIFVSHKYTHWLCLPNVTWHTFVSLLLGVKSSILYFWAPLIVSRYLHSGGSCQRGHQLCQGGPVWVLRWGCLFLLIDWLISYLITIADHHRDCSYSTNKNEIYSEVVWKNGLADSAFLQSSSQTEESGNFEIMALLLAFLLHIELIKVKKSWRKIFYYVFNTIFNVLVWLKWSLERAILCRMKIALC